MKYMNKILTLITGATLVIGCKDPELPAPSPSNSSSTVNQAKVMLVNAAPDAPSPLSFLVNNADGTPVAFMASSKISINPTSQQFRIVNGAFGIVGQDTVSQKGDLILQTTANGGANYTLILTDTVNRPFTKGSGFNAVTGGNFTGKGGLSFISLISDNLSAPAAGKAGIRFLNMAIGSSATFLTAGGNTLPNPLSNLSRTAKATSVTVTGTTTSFTGFTQVAAGSYNLEFRKTSVTTPSYISTTGTTFADGKLYTIILTGKVNSKGVVKVPYAVNIIQHN